MYLSARFFIAFVFLGGCTVAAIPARSAAGSGGAAPTISPTSRVVAAPPRDTVRATEATARFFEPLLAEVKTPAERASLLHQRGVLYLRSFMQEKALADLNEAMRLLPKIDAERSEVAFHRACALLLFPHANPKAALDDIDVRLAEYPDDAEALLVRGLAYRQRGEYALADADIARATSLAPKEDTAMHALIKRIQNQTP